MITSTTITMVNYNLIIFISLDTLKLPPFRYSTGKSLWLLLHDDTPGHSLLEHPLWSHHNHCILTIHQIRPQGSHLKIFIWSSFEDSTVSLYDRYFVKSHLVMMMSWWSFQMMVTRVWLGDFFVMSPTVSSQSKSQGQFTVESPKYGHLRVMIERIKYVYLIPSRLGHFYTLLILSLVSKEKFHAIKKFNISEAFHNYKLHLYIIFRYWD